MRTLPARFLVGMIRLYKMIVSPLLPPSCRYEPSCSEYAVEAIGRFGARRGGLMALRRILRCHPWARGGFDPVAREDDDSAEGPTSSHSQYCEVETRTLHG